MRKFLLLIFSLPIVFLSTQAKNYYFNGKEDSSYENPLNWSEYPGNVIHESDVVVIQSSANFEGFDIIVAGKLMIELGETLTSGGSGLQIKSSGVLFNEGEIGVDFIENYGKINNGLTAVIFTEKYYSITETEVQGMISFFFEPHNIENALTTTASVYMYSGQKSRGLKPVSSTIRFSDETFPVDTSRTSTGERPTANSTKYSNTLSFGE